MNKQKDRSPWRMNGKRATLDNKKVCSVVLQTDLYQYMRDTYGELSPGLRELIRQDRERRRHEHS